ncbi:MAG TPA: DUF47 family protein [Candidatus Sulfotelmatobacter sp.]|nr:DUF47 family protein [Candidatus Sulfotelmatobacter sp.]
MNWFEKRHRTEGLELAHKQIVKALDTIVFLNKAMQSYCKGNKTETKKLVEDLFKTEEEVDKLRSAAFKELSKGAALASDYREDLLHLVKRLDTVADDAKDAARCIEMLIDAQMPPEMLNLAVEMTDDLVETAQVLRGSIDAISNDPAEAIAGAHKVEDIEHKIDQTYLKTKSLFVKYGDKTNCGAMVIFDDMIEFMEQAADLCADTADYIVTLASIE